MIAYLKPSLTKILLTSPMRTTTVGLQLRLLLGTELVMTVEATEAKRL